MTTNGIPVFSYSLLPIPYSLLFYYPLPPLFSVKL